MHTQKSISFPSLLSSLISSLLSSHLLSHHVFLFSSSLLTLSHSLLFLLSLSRSLLLSSIEPETTDGGETDARAKSMTPAQLKKREKLKKVKIEERREKRDKRENNEKREEKGEVEEGSIVCYILMYVCMYVCIYVFMLYMLHFVCCYFILRVYVCMIYRRSTRKFRE